MRYVLFHGPTCPDGYGSAWAAYQKFGSEDTDYIPVSYGNPPPTELNDPGPHDVLIVDFSYPRDVLLDLAARHRVTVLDHHKTAEVDLAGLNFCTFDMQRSGAVLTWQHLYPGFPVPQLLCYIQDRDLWRFELVGSREISAWLYSHPFDFGMWSHLSAVLETTAGFDGAFRQGEALLRLQDKYVEIMVHHAQWAEVGGHRVPVANATVLFSEVGEKLCELHPEAPFAAYFSVRSDGQYQWGLRSSGVFDVSAVAQQYGGGGHGAAAGFVTEEMLS